MYCFINRTQAYLNAPIGSGAYIDGYPDSRTAQMWGYTPMLFGHCHHHNHCYNNNFNTLMGLGMLSSMLSNFTNMISLRNNQQSYTPAYPAYLPSYPQTYDYYPQNYYYNTPYTNTPFLSVTQVSNTPSLLDIFNNNYTPPTGSVNIFSINNTKQQANNTHRTANGNTRVQNALRIAENELRRGVRETSENDSTDIRRYKNGAKNRDPWCASFFSYLYGAGQGLSNSDTFGYTASSQEIKNRAGKHFVSKSVNYRPQPGDAAIWTNTNDSSHGHIGIVHRTDSNGIYVIEGNKSDAVEEHYYTYSQLQNEQRFNGYVKMNEWLG